jgi:hypothetical protein
MVNVGDLNGDGRPEYAGAYVSKAYLESWVLAASDQGCFSDLTDGGIGGKVSKPLSSLTKGWRDLEVLVDLNSMGGFMMRCGVTFAATFDGNTYKISRIVAVDVDKNAEITPRQCRKQAEEYLSSERGRR